MKWKTHRANGIPCVMLHERFLLSRGSKVKAYQGWTRAEAKKKSSARTRVLPIIFNFVDLVMKLVKDPRFSYLQEYAGNWPCDIIFVTVSYNSNKIKKKQLAAARHSVDDEIVQNAQTFY